jgi:hypothetical protein
MCHIKEAGLYFESWVKLLGPPFSNSQTLRDFLDPKWGMHMGLNVLNHGLAYALDCKLGPPI